MKTVLSVCIVLLLSVCSVNAIDFTQPLTPNAQTIGLWHMDSTYQSGGMTYTADAGPNGKDMMIDTWGTPPAPGTLVAGPTAALGNAINFGADDPYYAFYTGSGAWNDSYETFQVDGWFKFEAGHLLGSTKNLIETDAAWYLQKWADDTSAEIGLVVHFEDGTLGTRWIGGLAGLEDQWIHVSASFDQNQQINISVINLDGTFDVSATRDYTGMSIKNSGNERIYAGWKTFGVSFDELSVATVPEPATCALIGLGALLLRRRKA